MTSLTFVDLDVKQEFIQWHTDAECFKVTVVEHRASHDKTRVRGR